MWGWGHAGKLATSGSAGAYDDTCDDDDTVDDNDDVDDDDGDTCDDDESYEWGRHKVD